VGGGDEEEWEIEREGEVVILMHGIATCIILLFRMCFETLRVAASKILHSDLDLNGNDTNLFVSPYLNVSQIVAYPNIF
jgi:hypothetical protein